MKLAEALILRADIQKRIEQLKSRLAYNAKVQEGEKPSEEPNALLAELDALSGELERLIVRINLTNCTAKADGKSLIELIAKRDILMLKANMLRAFAQAAAQKVNLYSHSEIKILSTVDVAALQKQVDELARQIRQLDTTLQGANWQTDLIES